MTRSSPAEAARHRSRLAAAVPLAAVGFALLSHGRTAAPASVLTGLYAGLGSLLAGALGQLAALAAGRAGGAVLGATVGFGPRLADVTVRGVVVSVRRVPLPVLRILRVPVVAPGMRLRHWLTALLTLAVQAGPAAWLVTVPGAARWTGGGALAVCAAQLLGAWRPLSTGWVLLRMPVLGADAYAGLALTPGQVTAALALERGELVAAAAALDPPAPGADPGFREYLLRAAVADAQGRHGEAATLARAALDRAPGRLTAASAALRLAWALIGSAHTGALSPDGYLPPLRAAVDAAGAAAPGLLHSSPAPAGLALLDGDAAGALAPARRAAARAAGPHARAEAECGLAVALAAAGRAQEARQALERARALSPASARIAEAAARLAPTPAVPVP